MQQLNITQIETRWGYRTFELYQGDITLLETDVDVMVISAIGDLYFPVPGTVMGTLEENHGIDVQVLADECEFDLRDAFGCWVSRRLNSSRIGRILCIRMVGGDLDLDEAIENVFVVLSVLEAKLESDYKRKKEELRNRAGLKDREREKLQSELDAGSERVRLVALPMLGAGLGGLPAAQVMKSMLNHALSFMERSATVGRVLFVAFDADTAQELNAAMSAALRRPPLLLPRRGLIESLGRDLIAQIDRAQAIASEPQRKVLNELQRIIQAESSQAFQLGHQGRMLIEFVVNDIVKTKNIFELQPRIDLLGNYRVAPWIMTYMHVLRVFGNESVHPRDPEGRLPQAVDESDLIVALFCIRRILEFWVEYRSRKM